MKLKDYKKLVTKSEYKEADKSFTVNDNDKDLTPITISLPSPPDLKLIDGYGLPAKEQKFKYIEYPPRLKRLEEKTRNHAMAKYDKARDMSYTEQKFILEMWDVIEKLKSEYEQEVDWIRKQIYHVLNGYWFFCNGKPTYITGFHYAFLNFWYSPDLKSENFDYRDRDRRIYLFAEYIWNTTEDETGKDTGYRTFYGLLYPKHRRDGATHKFICAGYFNSIYEIGGHFGMQSFDETNAETHYKRKLVLAWERLPFFFKPVWKGGVTTAMFFGETRRSDYPVMNTKITYATSAGRKFYEGDTLTYLQVEEAGKTTLEDVSERWDVQKQCLGRADGAVIIGKVCFPTTVYELEGSGGREFKVLCDQSKFNERIPGKKQTLSGMSEFFIPAWDGLEQYIGPYGESVIDAPTPEQALFIRRDYGARQHLESENNILLQRGDSDSMSKYRERKRLYPMCYSDCFIANTGDMGFNMQILTSRRAELMRLRRQPVVRGNFFWASGGLPLSSDQIIKGGIDISKLGGNIVFEPDSVQGRWEVLETKGSGKRYIKDGHWFPSFPRYTTGADPFKFSMTPVKASKRLGRSRGGGAIVRNRDFSIDPAEKEIKDWETGNLIAYYNYRPDSDLVFVLDMLMPSIFYGSSIFPETNIEIVVSELLRMKFGGYLLFAVDEVTGKMKSTPGISTQTRSKEEIFQRLNRYIDFKGAKDAFLSFINDAIAINSPEELKHYDGLAAVGCALIGSESAQMAHQGQPSGDFDAGRVFKKRKYR